MEKLKELFHNKKFVMILSAIVIVAAGVGIGVFAYQSTRSEVAVAKVEKKEKVKKAVVEVPTFTACSLEGDSIEKDLTLIMKGDDGQKVSDVPFQVKLIPADQKEKIADAVQKIADVDAKITEMQAQADAEEQAAEGAGTSVTETAQVTEDTDKKVAEDVTAEDTTADEKTADTKKEDIKKEDTKKATKKKQEVSSLTGEAVTPLEKLYVEKQEAIDAYTEAIAAIDAKTYSDDDSDGMIYIESIDPGDYEACYIPTEGNDYSATNYAVDVNVKDKIEYVAVKNIAEKTVSASAAGDVQSSVKNVPVEATPTNTVEFVESRTEEIPAQYKQVATPVVQASAGAVATVASADGNASVGINQNATLYSGANGANSVAISVQTSGLAGGPQVTSSNGVVSVAGAAGAYTITAGSTPEDATVNVTVSGTPTSNQNETVSATCSVLVHGANKALTASDGQALYIDTNGTPATYGNYNPSGAYYVKEKDAEARYYGWQEIGGYRYYFDKNGNKVTGTQVINGATYNFGSDGVLLTSGFGIDVSKWQGNIDWAQASSAVSFAIIRCGFRGSSGNIAVDPKFAQNIQGAKANGVRVGVYFYSIAMNEAQAVEEASLAVQQVSQYGGVSLPIYIDMEDSRQLALSQAERDAIVMAFCRTVQNSGYSAGVYANKNWLTNYLTPSSYSGISIWVAQYNTQCTYKGRYDIWQYSSKGSIPGIGGNVDLNTSYF